MVSKCGFPSSLTDEAGSLQHPSDTSVLLGAVPLVQMLFASHFRGVFELHLSWSLIQPFSL